ncbi:transcriptional regulator, TetR family [Geodermatophilus pulveris]|uniref:Transcriptional regulator, TetR family n=1 Tax=Geodermatophilus pulveris TaxID=1564159 RepID=A0A239DQI5_9ACTN|nr:TetR/AcrR family transcriptional regulator [Geodermatophilus pulveris]SNS34449.1 transcriptional regulator, TetR family [Geodermatophilus pulveris]
MIVTQEAPPVRSPRGGRPRDPSRDGVIRAAILRLLAEVGYGALTMDAVAAEAGVGKATIYRRWRTKQDLVADTITELNATTVTPADTGSLQTDLREVLYSIVDVINGPMGAATRALLSTVTHHPALGEAFGDGPVGVWRRAFGQVFARAEARGELRPGLAGTVVAEALMAPLVQRWLMTGHLVTRDYADEVLGDVALPLLRANWGPSA